MLTPNCPGMNHDKPHRWFNFARMLTIGLLAASLLHAGCGYAHRPLFNETYRTVSVPIFDNRSFYRGVEFDLTEALKKEIELRTPYKVVNGTSGDTLLHGAIVSISQRRLSRNREGGLVQELELHLVIDFEWKDQRTGKTIVDRQGLTAASSYVPAQPIAQPLELGEHLAVQRAATAVVAAMGGDW